jgi:putative PepSY-like beta-lactamase-inhibitor
MKNIIQMKKTLLLIVVLFTSFNFSFAQEKKIKAPLVPESVLNAYKEKYKKLEIKSWYQDGDMYSAVFDKGENTYKAFFNSDGKWLKTTTKIKEAQVSGAVKKAIKNTEWSDWKMSECYKVETPEYKKIFELHLKKGKEVKVLSFDPTGKAIEIK